MWLAKKAGRNRALRWVEIKKKRVKTEIVEVAYADGNKRKVRRPLLEIFEPPSPSEVDKGTSSGGSATCPLTGFTTAVERVRIQLERRSGGASDARLLCVVTTTSDAQGRRYRLPSMNDVQAIRKVVRALNRLTGSDSEQRPLVPRARSTTSVDSLTTFFMECELGVIYSPRVRY